MPKFEPHIKLMLVQLQILSEVVFTDREDDLCIGLMTLMTRQCWLSSMLQMTTLRHASYNFAVDLFCFVTTFLILHCVSKMCQLWQAVVSRSMD